MNWFGQQAGEGFEYHLLAIAIALALTLAGAGNWSIDKAIASLGFWRYRASSVGQAPPDATHWT